MLVYFQRWQPDPQQMLLALAGFLLCAFPIWNYVELTHTAQALVNRSLAEVNQARKWTRFLEQTMTGLLLISWLWIAQEQLVKPLLVWCLGHLGLLVVEVLVGGVLARHVLPLLWKVCQVLLGRREWRSITAQPLGHWHGWVSVWYAGGYSGTGRSRLTPDRLSAGVRQSGSDIVPARQSPGGDDRVCST